MRTRFLSQTELDRLRGTMCAQDWALCALMLETGLRISDALALKWENYDEQISGFVFTAKKTGKKGVARLSRDTLQEMQKYRRGAYCFASPRKLGHPITRQCAWKRIKKACEKAGISPRGVANHSLRKCFAVETFRKDGLDATKRALQHDSTEVTEIYALSDFLSEKNEHIPLFRKDIPIILHLLQDLMR